MVKYEWRLRGGVSVLSSTTLSEAKDNGAGTLENQNGNAPSPQDFRNIDADFGLSNYHQPYNNTTSFVLELPVGRGDGGWATLRARSICSSADGSLPASARSTPASRSPSRIRLRRPSWCPASAGFPRRKYFSSEPERRSRFQPNGTEHQQLVQSRRGGCARPNPQPFGNAPRNNVRGPVFWQIDFAMSKHFALPWRSDFEFRLESFNLLNRTNFRPPNGNRSAGAFGTITSTYDARQLQLGFKLMF